MSRALVLTLFACGNRPVEPPPTPAGVPAPTPGAPAPAPAPAVSDWPAACPQPSDPGVHYQHATWAERELCSTIRFRCEAHQEPLVSPPGVECGCGCIPRRTDDSCNRDDECEIVNTPCTCDMVVVNHAAADRLRTEGAACAVTPSCAAPKSLGPLKCVDSRCTIAP